MNGRLFTVEEANALLPTLIPLVERMLEARSEIVASSQELGRVIEKSVGNGGSKGASETVPHIVAVQDTIADIEALGCQMKDVNSGLVDFPSERDGEEILLCWRYGEEAVEWWHDPDAGFAGRQRL